MKNIRYLLICAVAISALLSTGRLTVVSYVLADEPTLPRESKPVLISKANPALKGINTVVFSFTPGEAESDRAALWSSLRKGFTNQLSRADIGWHMPPAGAVGPLDMPVLKLVVDMLKTNDSQQYVFRVQTSLSAVVCLKDDSSVCLKAELWKISSQMQAVSEKDLSAAIIEETLRQAEAFTLAYSAANQAKVDKQVRYVASKNSKIFHKPDCAWAKRISPENLVGFATREQAVKAGKRPCKRCNP